MFRSWAVSAGRKGNDGAKLHAQMRLQMQMIEVPNRIAQSFCHYGLQVKIGGGCNSHHSGQRFGLPEEQLLCAAVIACAMPSVVWLTRFNGLPGATCKPND
ncbi:hypothetical protein D9M70_541720 [compost metagenome]